MDFGFDLSNESKMLALYYRTQVDKSFVNGCGCSSQPGFQPNLESGYDLSNDSKKMAKMVKMTKVALMLTSHLSMGVGAALAVRMDHRCATLKQ